MNFLEIIRQWNSFSNSVAPHRAVLSACMWVNGWGKEVWEKILTL